MVATIGKFFESIGSFFGGGDQIPWCDHDTVMGLELEVAVTGVLDFKIESVKRLCWAQVHSRQPQDLWHGASTLEAFLDFDDSSPLEMREQLYLLAIAYYRSGDYSLGLHHVERCLEITPDWRQALTLKKKIKDKIAIDGVIGIARTGIMAVALLAGGIVAALARKN